MIGAPCGGGETVKLTDACVSPGIAVAFVGAAGTAMPGGVAGALGAESGLVPDAFVALTVKVYAVKFVSPLIKSEVGGKRETPATGVTGVEETRTPPTNMFTV